MTVTLLQSNNFATIFASMEALNANSSFSWDVNMRNSVPIFTLCQIYRLFMYLGTSQIQVQRYLMCKSVRDARIALAIGTLSIALITALMTICGMAALVHFEGCDPLQNP